MKWKIFIGTIIILTLGFGLGWYLNDLNDFAEGVRKETNQSINLKKIDSLIIETNTYDKTKNYSKILSGEFILKDATCAGFNFINTTKASWTNEMDCHPDTLKLGWLNNATFFVKDINRGNENCPPRVWIYQVISFDEKKLILKDIWTGWNELTDTKLEFIKSTNR